MRSSTPRVAVTSLVAAAFACSALTSPAATAAPANQAGSGPGTQAMQASWHGTSWSVPIDFGGRAVVGSKVSVTTACAVGTCSATTTTNVKGRWKLRLDAIVAPGRTAMEVTLASGKNRLVRTFSITKPASTKPGAGTVMVIGDSLAVGTAKVLPGLLPDRPVTTQAAVGRPLARGLSILANTPLDASIRVAVFSLFTNDDPAAVDTFVKGVKATLTRLGPTRCAVWFTIRRPAVSKVSYRQANEALLALAADPAYGGRLIVVPWAQTVDDDHAILGADRVHPTAAGYELRARLTADAVRSCPVLG